MPELEGLEIRLPLSKQRVLRPRGMRFGDPPAIEQLNLTSTTHYVSASDVTMSDESLSARLTHLAIARGTVSNSDYRKPNLENNSCATHNETRTFEFSDCPGSNSSSKSRRSNKTLTSNARGRTHFPSIHCNVLRKIPVDQATRPAKAIQRHESDNCKPANWPGPTHDQGRVNDKLEELYVTFRGRDFSLSVAI